METKTIVEVLPALSEPILKTSLTVNKSLLRAKATGSGADQWCHCPASVAMQYHLTEAPKDYAEEGTAAHDVAAKVLQQNIPTEDFDAIKALVPKAIDDLADRVEMVNAVITYVDYIRAMPEEPDLLIAEERLGFLGSSGQLDCYCIKGRIGYIHDFKYGIGKKIYADENPQLAFYACALKKKFPGLKTIHCSLIQPRVEGLFDDTPSITTWSLPWQTLLAWERKFDAALKEVEKAQMICAGPWCQFCKARGGCPTHLTYAETCRAEQESFSTDLIPAPGADYLPAVIPRIAAILKYEDHVTGWFKKGKEFLLNLALQGYEIPGFKLAEGRSNRRWQEIYTDEQIADILIERGIPEPYKKELIPLTQAEKLGVDVSDIVEKPKGKPKLKSVDKKSR